VLRETPMSKDNRNSIACRVCGKKLRVVGHAHLAVHGMSVEEYKEAYGIGYVMCDELRSWNSKRKSRHKRRPGFTLRTKDQILCDLKSLSKRGVTMRYRELQEADTALFKQAKRVFGTWQEAVEAAGLKPTPPLKEPKWDKKIVVKTIQQMAKSGKPLNFGAVKRANPLLLAATQYHFGSWPNAVRAAGLKPQKLERGWPRKRMLEEAKSWISEHGPLNSSTLLKSRRPLLMALVRRYGSVEEAAKKLRLPCAPTRRRR